MLKTDLPHVEVGNRIRDNLTSKMFSTASFRGREISTGFVIFSNLWSGHNMMVSNAFKPVLEIIFPENELDAEIQVHAWLDEFVRAFKIVWFGFVTIIGSIITIGLVLGIVGWVLMHSAGADVGEFPAQFGFVVSSTLMLIAGIFMVQFGWRFGRNRVLPELERILQPCHLVKVSEHEQTRPSA